MNIVRIFLSLQYQCTTEKSLSEQSVTIGAKNVDISHRLKRRIKIAVFLCCISS